MDAEFPLEELSPTDAAIVAMVRDRRPPAEIAVRLGLNGSEIRARLDRLASVGGDGPTAPVVPIEAGSELAPQERRGWPRRAAALAVVIVAGVAALGAWLMPRGGDAEEGKLASAEERKPAATAGAQGPARVKVVLVEGQPWLNLGHVLDPEAIGLLTDRATLTVVRLTGRSTLTLPGPAGAWHIADTAVGAPGQVVWLRGNVGGQETELMFRALGSSWFEPLAAEDGTIQIDVAGVDVPMLVVAAFPVAEDPAAWPGHRRLALDASGRMLLGAGPLPLDPSDAFVAFADRADDRETGRRLDGATGLATECAAQACSALITARAEIRAPAAGTVGCADGATMLETADFRLRLRPVFDGGPAGPRSCEASPGAGAGRHVEPGEPIVVGAGGWIFEVNAWALDGRPLSVAVSRDGDLWVGELAPTASCACAPQN